MFPFDYNESPFLAKNGQEFKLGQKHLTERGLSETLVNYKFDFRFPTLPRSKRLEVLFLTMSRPSFSFENVSDYNRFVERFNRIEMTRENCNGKG